MTIFPTQLAAQIGGTPPSDDQITGGATNLALNPQGGANPAAAHMQQTFQQVQTPGVNPVVAPGQITAPQTPGAVNQTLPQTTMIATNPSLQTMQPSQTGWNVTHPGAPVQQTVGQQVQQPAGTVPVTPGQPIMQPGQQLPGQQPQPQDPTAPQAPVLSPDAKIQVRNADGTVSEISATDVLAFRQQQQSLTQGGMQTQVPSATADPMAVQKRAMQEYNQRGGPQLSSQITAAETELKKNEAALIRLDQEVETWKATMTNPATAQRQDFTQLSNRFTMKLNEQARLVTTVENGRRAMDSLYQNGAQLRAEIMKNALSEKYPAITTPQGMSEMQGEAQRLYGMNAQTFNSILADPNYAEPMLDAIAYRRIVNSNSQQMAVTPQTQAAVILNAAGAQPNQTQVAGVPAMPAGGQSQQDSMLIQQLAVRYNQALQAGDLQSAQAYANEIQAIHDIPAELRGGAQANGMIH